jgi:predicted esterase
MRRFGALFVFLFACGGDEAGTSARFVIPGDTAGPTDDFYSLPFPNDLWRAGGTLDLSLFPTNSLIVDTYREAAQELDGFGLNQAIFTRFDGPLDNTSLPDPAASMVEGASVYLVDVDPASPTHGARTPLAVKFRAAATQTLGDNHIVARPYPGFGLRGGTTYALVVTDRVRAADGGSVTAAPRFRELLGDGGDALIVDARQHYQPLLDWLDEPGDDERGAVISAAVFTTQHATAIMPALRKGVFSAPAPVAADVVAGAASPDFKLFTGTYQAPNLQEGDVPYHEPPTGRITVAGDAAVVQRMEPMRFALTVPLGATPAGGFPVAIYSHGTGGDFKSFTRDGTATALAKQGIAVISTDQVLHGPRNPGGNVETDFFNIANPYAMRDNALQGAADAWSQMRLANAISIVDGARTITLDPTRLYFFGHSQGGLTGPGFVAFEPALSGAVLSGTGGLLYLALLYKTAPLDIPMLVQTFLRDDPVDEDNPSLALFQMWAERVDGGNYAPLMVREPALAPDGTALPPRNIFQTEGFTDTFTPNPSIEAFATALGGDLVMTAATQDVPGLDLRARTVKAPPFSDNLDGATAVLAQYDQEPGSDGHFVVFDIAAATRQASEFLGTLARTGTATIVAPN